MRVVTCVFPGPAVYAKGARGAMCRHVVVNEVTDVDGLKAFVGNDGEWSFSSETKSDDENTTLTFSRSDTKKKAAATGGKKAKAAKASKPAPTLSFAACWLLTLLIARYASAETRWRVLVSIACWCCVDGRVVR